MFRRDAETIVFKKIITHEKAQKARPRIKGAIFSRLLSSVKSIMKRKPNKTSGPRRLPSHFELESSCWAAGLFLQFKYTQIKTVIILKN